MCFRLLNEIVFHLHLHRKDFIVSIFTWPRRSVTFNYAFICLSTAFSFFFVSSKLRLGCCRLWFVELVAVQFYLCDNHMASVRISLSSLLLWQSTHIIDIAFCWHFVQQIYIMLRFAVAAAVVKRTLNLNAFAEIVDQTKRRVWLFISSNSNRFCFGSEAMPNRLGNIHI